MVNATSESFKKYYNVNSLFMELKHINLEGKVLYDVMSITMKNLLLAMN